MGVQITAVVAAAVAAATIVAAAVTAAAIRATIRIHLGNGNALKPTQIRPRRRTDGSIINIGPNTKTLKKYAG
jgi:hypothetical protein